DRREGRVPARVGIEGRYPDEAVDAGLGLRVAVGVRSRNGEGGALEPRALTGLVLEQLDPEAPALAPAEGHAEQHLGPVLRLETTGARVYLDDRVAGVVLAAEETGQLEVAQLALDLLHPLRELAEGVGITFLRQLEVHARLVGALAQALPAVERRLESR